MEPTGERTVPGIDREQYFFARHDAVYRWVCSEFATDLAAARILDAGSGEGYGAALLAESGATAVIGLEYDDQACRHAAGRYPLTHVVRANLAHLPLRNHSIDMVITLQVIEHLWDLSGFLTDLLRAVRPGGRLVASTPNRATFSPGLGRGERPINPFHVEEFDAEQVHDLLAAAGWRDVRVLGLHHGRRITEWEAHHGSIMAAQVTAALADDWPDDLIGFIAQITAADFTIASDTGSAQDLIAIGRAPEPLSA